MCERVTQACGTNDATGMGGGNRATVLLVPSCDPGREQQGSKWTHRVNQSVGNTAVAAGDISVVQRGGAVK